MSSIGNNIRMLRTRQRQTLEEVARACGCTRSLLSKIENGKSTPPLATLMRIAAALGVKVAVLLAEDEGQGSAYVSAARITPEAMVRTEKGYSFYTFVPEIAGKMMQPFLFTARKGEVREHKLTHAGEEFVYMLEGRMSYRVGGIEYTLNTGDALYFDSGQTHSFTPLSDEVRYLGVFAESPVPAPQRVEQAPED